MGLYLKRGWILSDVWQRLQAIAWRVREAILNLSVGRKLRKDGMGEYERQVTQLTQHQKTSMLLSLGPILLRKFGGDIFLTQQDMIGLTDGNIDIMMESTPIGLHIWMDVPPNLKDQPWLAPGWGNA